mmetsp:Transcript_26639/g.82068  ORF Transcript_26639/g.82068 Transcript_26639/m.82068 type:complete len:338 (+) Transcript_26639:76-1089(+)
MPAPRLWAASAANLSASGPEFPLALCVLAGALRTLWKQPSVMRKLKRRRGPRARPQVEATVTKRNGIIVACLPHYGAEAGLHPMTLGAEEAAEADSSTVSSRSSSDDLAAAAAAEQLAKALALAPAQPLAVGPVAHETAHELAEPWAHSLLAEAAAAGRRVVLHGPGQGRVPAPEEGQGDLPQGCGLLRRADGRRRWPDGGVQVRTASRELLDDPESGALAVPEAAAHPDGQRHMQQCGAATLGAPGVAVRTRGHEEAHQGQLAPAHRKPEGLGHASLADLQVVAHRVQVAQGHSSHKAHGAARGRREGGPRAAERRAPQAQPACEAPACGLSPKAT